MAGFKIRFCKSITDSPGLIRGGFTTTLEVSGTPTVTRQLLATNPLLTLQSLTVSGEGQRTAAVADQGCEVRILFDQAHVEGMFAQQPFSYDLLPSMAGNFNGDKVLEMTWGLAMAGRHYRLGPKGEYQLAKAGADPHGEGYAVMIDAPVRVPEERVNVGDEWTTEWMGEARHKDTGAVFHYKQVALLQEITEAPAVRAHIAFKTIGTLQFPDQPSPQLEETVLETKGTIVLDLETGLPVMSEAFGMMTTDLKRAGVKLERGTSARYELR